MDEVFDLKKRNQWLRRQIVAALQQVIRTIFGDRMNKKIVDYVDSALSADQVPLLFVNIQTHPDCAGLGQIISYMGHSCFNYQLFDKAVCFFVFSLLYG